MRKTKNKSSTIHYIWIGSAITRCNYKQNIAQASQFEFVENVVLWADNLSDASQTWCKDNNVELRYIGDRKYLTTFLGKELAPYYFNALDKLPPNYAVAADILRLQIIISEAGLYLDVDVNIGTKNGDNITKGSLEKILSSPTTLIGDGNDILFQPAGQDATFYRDVKKLMISRLQENSYSNTKEDALILSRYANSVIFEKLEYTLQTTGPALYRDKVLNKKHPEVDQFKRRCENSAKSWLGKKNKWKYWSLSRVKSITLSNIIADMRVQIGERRKSGPNGKMRLNFAKYEPVIRVLASNNSETRNEILKQLIPAILTEELSKTVTIDDCVFYEDQDKRLFSTIKATTLSQQKIKHKVPQVENQQSIDKEQQAAYKIQRLFRKYSQKKQQARARYKKLYAESKQLNYRLWTEATYLKQKTPSTETVELLKKVANATKAIQISTLIKAGISNASSTLKSYDAWRISFFTYFDLKDFGDNTEVLEAVFGKMGNPNRSTIRRAMMFLLAHDRYEEIKILEEQYEEVLCTNGKDSINIKFNESDFGLIPGETFDIKMRKGFRRHGIQDFNVSITELVERRQNWQKEAAYKIQRLFRKYSQKKLQARVPYKTTPIK